MLCWGVCGCSNWLIFMSIVTTVLWLLVRVFIFTEVPSSYYVPAWKHTAFFFFEEEELALYHRNTEGRVSTKGPSLA